jgi:hypothetical protein
MLRKGLLLAAALVACSLPVANFPAKAQTTDSLTPTSSPTQNVLTYCYDFGTSLWKRIDGGNTSNFLDGVAIPSTGCVPINYGLNYLFNGSSAWDRLRSAASQPQSPQGAARVSAEIGHQQQYNISAATTVKITGGRLGKVTVVTSAATTSAVCDVNGACAANNTILSIPASAPAGTVYDLNWPCSAGIRVEPGAGVVLAISYE